MSKNTVLTYSAYVLPAALVVGIFLLIMAKPSEDNNKNETVTSKIIDARGNNITEEFDEEERNAIFDASAISEKGNNSSVVFPLNPKGRYLDISIDLTESSSWSQDGQSIQDASMLDLQRYIVEEFSPKPGDHILIRVYGSGKGTSGDYDLVSKKKEEIVFEGTKWPVKPLYHNSQKHTKTVQLGNRVTDCEDKIFYTSCYGSDAIWNKIDDFYNRNLQLSIYEKGSFFLMHARNVLSELPSEEEYTSRNIVFVHDGEFQLHPNEYPHDEDVSLDIKEETFEVNNDIFEAYYSGEFVEQIAIDKNSTESPTVLMIGVQFKDNPEYERNLKRFYTWFFEDFEISYF